MLGPRPIHFKPQLPHQKGPPSPPPPPRVGTHHSGTHRPEGQKMHEILGIPRHIVQEHKDQGYIVTSPMFIILVFFYNSWPLPCSLYLLGRSLYSPPLNHRSLQLYSHASPIFCIWSFYLPFSPFILSKALQYEQILHTANEGPMRIQYKCLVPIYVFPELKLRSLITSKTEL